MSLYNHDLNSILENLDKFLSSEENEFIYDVIDGSNVDKISSSLERNSITIKSNNNITVAAKLEWFNSSSDLTIITSQHIIFKYNSFMNCAGNLFLKAGIENKFGKGLIVFEDVNEEDCDEISIAMDEGKEAVFYYHPEKLPSKNHKFLAPDSYFCHVLPRENQKSYLLVHDVDDLSKLSYFPHRNYALARDIDATSTKHWYNGKGFKPIYGEKTGKLFYGDFDGNNYAIKDLYINRTDELEVALFRKTLGYDKDHDFLEIKNIVFENCYVAGNNLVGLIAGTSQFTSIHNITVINSSIIGQGITGSLVGTAYHSKIYDIDVTGIKFNDTAEYRGDFAGVNTMSNIDVPDDSQYIDCVGYTSKIGEEALDGQT